MEDLSAPFCCFSGALRRWVKRGEASIIKGVSDNFLNYLPLKYGMITNVGKNVKEFVIGVKFRQYNLKDWGWSALYSLVSGYLLMALYQLVIQQETIRFVQLDPEPPIGLFAVLWLGGTFLCLALAAKVSFKFSESIFAGLILAYIALATFYSPILLITIGYLVLVVALGAKFYLSRSSWFYGFLTMGFFSLGKIVFQLWQGPGGVDLGRFNPEWSGKSGALLLVVVLALILGIILAFLFVHLFQRYWDTHRSVWISCALWLLGIGVTLAFVGILSVFMIAKEKTLSTSTFDMGIFTQMFENMRSGLGPITTVERDQPLSHMAVHMSPIFYLLLPIYSLSPRPETLQVLQIVIVASGIIPFYLISRQIRIHPWVQGLATMLFIVAPTMATSNSYDFHENSFLAPLVLWVIYANLSQRTWLMALTTLLTLMIKEDAMIYVVSIAIYFLCQSRFKTNPGYRMKVIVLEIILPLIYFGAVVFWIQTQGQGLLSDRYALFMNGPNQGLSNVIINAVVNPSFTWASFFSQTKITYLFVIIGSMAFLPLLQRRWENYLLMVPLFAINLMTDYPYQSNFYFQYNYGTTALMLFMSLLALESLQEHSVQLKGLGESTMSRLSPIVIGATSVALAISVTTNLTLSDPLAYAYRIYRQDPNKYDADRAVLRRIPRRGRVLAFGFFVPPLADVKNLYDMVYHNQGAVDPSIDYVIYRKSLLESDNREAAIFKAYSEAGYRVSGLSQADIIILEKD